MIYPVSLATVALFVGFLYVVLHGAVWWKSASAPALLKTLPRHRALGWVLLALATLWFALLLGNIDLMEYTPHRRIFVMAVLVIGGLSAVYLTEFLTARALGALLLLGAQVLLDAAFLQNETSRLVVTVTAYGWIIAGMFLVGMPYVLRDVIAWLAAKSIRLRVAAAAGTLWGGLLLFLGLFVYPG